MVRTTVLLTSAIPLYAFSPQRLGAEVHVSQPKPERRTIAPREINPAIPRGLTLPTGRCIEALEGSPGQKKQMSP